MRKRVKKAKKIKRQSLGEVAREISELLSRNNYIIYTAIEPKNWITRLLRKFIKVKVSLKIIPRELLDKNK